MRLEWIFRCARRCRGWWTPAGLGLILLASGLAVPAGELPQPLVITDAKWVVHVDMDALKKTELYRYLRDNGQATGIFNLSFSIAKDEFKMDFTRCESLTFYGKMDDDDESWVGILKMPPAYRHEILASLERLAKREDSPLEKIPENKSWNGFEYDGEVSVYSPKRDLFIIGEVDAAEKACQIATGKVPNAPSALLRGWDAKGAPFVSFACVRGPDDDSPLPDGIDFNLNLANPLAKAVPNLAQAIDAGQFGAICQGSVFVGETTMIFG